MKSIFTIFLWILSTNFVFGQFYEKSYTSTGVNWFGSLSITNNNLLIGAGMTAAGSSEGDMLISFLQPDGTMLNSQTFGRSGRDYIYDAYYDAAHGNLIIVGNSAESAGSTTDIFFVGIYDLATNTLQMQRYVGNLGSDDQLRQVTYTSDDHILMVGDISQTNDAMIVKIDTLGNIVWQRKHNFGSANVKDQFRDIEEVTGQGYIVSGLTNNFSANNYQTTLTRVATDGSQLWSKAYTSGSNATLDWRPMAKTADGGFIVGEMQTNNGQTDILVFKTDAQGNVQWSKLHNAPNNDYLITIKAVSNNEFILGGRTFSFGNAGGEAFLTKIDQQGDIIWSRTFGQPNQQEEIFDIEQNANGIYAAGRAITANNEQYPYLVHVANDGSGLDCLSSTAFSVTTNQTMTVSNGGTFAQIFGTVNFLLTQGTTTFTEVENECLSIDLDTDNSSGAIGSDFNAGNACQNDVIPICDSDVSVTAVAGIDSIQIFISNSAFLATGAEFLSIGNTNVIVQGANTANITLIATPNGTTTADFIAALQTIRFQNNSAQPMAGQKAVSVIAYSQGIISNTALALFLIASPVAASPNLGNDTTICTGEMINLNVTRTGATYLWQDGSTAPIYNITQAGTYSVTITETCASVSDTIVVSYAATDLTLNLGKDTVLCGSATLTLNAAHPSAQNYLWQNGSTAPTFLVTQSGTYFVAISDTCATIFDTIQVIITNSPPDVDLGQDTFVCAGNTLFLNASSPLANTYLWQDGSTSPTYAVTTGGIFRVSATNDCGTSSDTINITLEISTIDVQLGSDTSLCNGDALLLNAAVPTDARYLWQDGSTASSFNVTQTGLYSVQISDKCLTVADSIFVNFVSLSLNLGNDTSICAGNLVLLQAFYPDATSYEWQDGSNQSFFIADREGNYAVTVTNACGSRTDSVFVIVNTQIPLPNLGNNRVFCPNATERLDATTPNANVYLWQDGSTDPVYTATEAGSYAVTVSNACGSRTERIDLIAEACCTVFIPDVFTPNNDGINDELITYSSCNFANFSLQVYDRWGAKVFETTDVNQGWNGISNGSPLKNGVFVWVARYNDGFQDQQQQGSVTLVR